MHRFPSLNTSVLDEDDGNASDATLLRAASPSPKPVRFLLVVPCPCLTF
jgi:hypothetical protein